MALRSINRVTLLGRMGRDAELSYTPSGSAVVKFSLATSRSWKDKASNDWKEETTWTNIVWWNGEKAAQYLTKGTQLYVEGRLQTRSYDDKEGKKVYVTEVVAEEVILLGGKDAGEHRQEATVTAVAGGGKSPYPPPKPISQSLEITDDDIPF